MKYDELLDIKNDFYVTFKGPDWFRGAGLYRADKKKDWSIIALVREDSKDKIPDLWKSVEIVKTLFT